MNIQMLSLFVCNFKCTNVFSKQKVKIIVIVYISMYKTLVILNAILL